MPVPVSPISALVAALNQSPSLKGFAPVLAGKNRTADQAAPPRIVLFPVQAGYNSPHDNVMAFVDVDLKCSARIWGRDLDDAWDLRQRFIQGMWQVGIGNPSQPMKAADAQAGPFFQLIDEAWDTTPDTAQQGQELEVVFTIRGAGAIRIQPATGSVEAVALHGIETLLTADMTTTDTTATVNSTAGFAASGTLSIDGEQISYTGLTATSFTGLVRGLNGTTAATHTAAAPVWQ